MALVLGVVCVLVVWLTGGDGGVAGSCLVMMANIQWLLLMLIGSSVWALLMLCILFLRMMVE